jgi:DNA repair protein SbcC/Rad50
MIKSVKIKNFQSHKETSLEFHQGLNGIVGTSDSGKSAILRALHWNRENRPTGEAHISRWAKDEKKRLIDDCSVTVEPSVGPVTRRRSSDFNGYEVDGQTLEAIKTEVPQAVTDAYNFTDVNVQRQLDPPFLLSKSGPEVSRFFNQILKLEKMDQLISAAASKADRTAGELRDIVGVKNKSAKQNKKGKIDDVVEKIEALDWIDEAKVLLSQIGTLEDTINSTEASIRLLQVLVSQIEKAKQDIAKYSEVAGLGDFVEVCQASCDKANKLSLSVYTLSNLRHQIDEAKVLADKSQAVVLTEPLVEACISANKQAIEAERRVNDLQSTVTVITSIEKAKQKADLVLSVIPELEKSQILQSEIQSTEVKILSLSQARSGVMMAEQSISRLSPAIACEASIVEATERLEEYKALEKKQASLFSASSLAKMTQKVIDKLAVEVVELEKNLPEQCPTCGSLIPHAH